MGDITIAEVINDIIIVAIGALGTLFVQSVLQWSKGRKDEAQRIAQKVDELKERIKEERGRTEAQRNDKDRYRNEYLYLRRWILTQDLSPEQFSDLPAPPREWKDD